MNTIPRRTSSRLFTWCLGSLLAVTGAFIFTLLSSSTREFWDLGAVGSVLFGLPLAILSMVAGSVAFLVTGRLIAKRNLDTLKQRFLLLAPWLVVTAFWIGSAAICATPRSRFRSVIMAPVPSTVRDIRTAGINSFLSRRWLVTFQIDPAQIGNIVTKHSMVQTNYYNFQGVIERDFLFKRLTWAHSVGQPTNALYFTRIETVEPPSRWVSLLFDKDSSRAWFMLGYQN